MMRLMFDARKAEDFGIGAYIRGLLGALTAARPEWRFVVLVAPASDPAVVGLPLGDNVEFVVERAGNYSVAEPWSLGARARAHKIDLFHSPHYIFPRGLTCPGVATIHDCIHLRFPAHLPRPAGVLPRSLSRAYAGWMIRHATRAAERVIAVSEATRADLIARVGADPGRVVAVLNGGGSEAIADHLGDEDAGPAAIPGLPHRYMLFVGNPKRHKNLPGLLEAFARAAEQHPDVHLCVAGPDSALAAALSSAPPSIADRIQNLGYLAPAQLRAAYRGALAVCVPSLYEGFGLPALEAMAAATAVIATDAGGLPEVVGDAGLLVQAGDPGALATAIDRLLTDGSLRAELAERGRRRAAQFSWQRAAASTLAVYASALGKAEIP